MASDGSVWVVGCFSGRVFVYEPSGALRRTIPIPIDIGTNVCFGGPELRDVYITTGALDPSKKDGRVFHMVGDVPGVPVTLVRIPVDGQAQSPRP